MKTNHIFSLLITAMTLGCIKEETGLLHSAEKVVPGIWQIESVQLPRNGSGVTYQGNTFIADTTLFDVGRIEINNFSTDTLSPQINDQHRVKCVVTIGNETFPFCINHLGLSGSEIFSGFEWNGPPGIDTIDTPGEQFIWSAFIFNNNYIIQIVNEDNIVLRKASDQNGHVITLKRM